MVNEVISNIYNNWKKQVEPHVSQDISEFFKGQMIHVGILFNNRNYSKAMNKVQEILDVISPDIYKDKHAGPGVSKAWTELCDLEKTLNSIDFFHKAVA